jgi:hypothetical protein
VKSSALASDASTNSGPRTARRISSPPSKVFLSTDRSSRPVPRSSLLAGWSPLPHADRIRAPLFVANDPRADRTHARAFS